MTITWDYLTNNVILKGQHVTCCIYLVMSFWSNDDPIVGFAIPLFYHVELITIHHENTGSKLKFITLPISLIADSCIQLIRTDDVPLNSSHNRTTLQRPMLEIITICWHVGSDVIHKVIFTSKHMFL